MKKLLVADQTEINRSILYSIFASQFELLQADGSEFAYQLLLEHHDEISMVLIHESIAARFTPEAVRTLSSLKIFDYIPVILILDSQSSHINKHHLSVPFCDVLNSPINPYIAKKRIANLIELFSTRTEMEDLVNAQTKKILEQNQRLKNQQKKINTINNDMLDTLSTVIEYRDVESGRHIHRIRRFTEALLRVFAERYPKYGLTEEKIELISSASSIHDIGKIAIPDSILLSPRRLTYDEFRIMKQHTIKGCEILEQLDAVEKNEYYRYCYDICRYHHEKWDGLGYPDGISGDRIPIWAQVVSMADCYDALTSERPYKTAFSHEQAVEMIRNGACGAFSDEMMECFTIVLPEFKALAIEYSDSDHRYRSVRGKSEDKKPEQEENDDHSRDVYLKMDRRDLIDTIEHQKKLMEETSRFYKDVLYKATDFVLEFDIRNDLLHERKGSLKDICGYIPKNYDEAVNILSECCADSYRNRFIREFRIKSVMDAVENRQDSIILECPMDLGNGVLTTVRCSMIPEQQDGELSRLFFVMSELHDSVVNSPGSDQDAVTGLWNYTGIRREVNDFIAHTGGDGYHALIVIDIDNFKMLNRKTDYRFGNDVLCDVSELLKEQITYGNILGRIEDDNFVAFIKDCPDENERMELIEDIFRCLHKTYEFSGEILPPITATMGISSYPADGSDFDELFRKASKAVEIAKLNGKNMYLFYNKSMGDNWELKKYSSEVRVRQTADVELFDKKEYFIPVVSSGSGRIISYDMIEMNGDYYDDTAGMYEAVVADENMTALSLNNLTRLMGSIYNLEQENTALPEICLYTMFDGQDRESVLDAFSDILKKFPLDCRNICIMLSHEMLDQLTINELTGFVSTLKSVGFKVGLFNVGIGSINVNCFIEKLFDRIVFAQSFLQSVTDGIYNITVLSELINYFIDLGAMPIVPAGVTDDVVRALKEKTPHSFGMHKNEVIPLPDFKLQMQASAVVEEYPVLSHENTELVPNDKMYDEILIQTRSFILEWLPRLDQIKLTGSFKDMYGYMPESEDFLKNIREQKFIHPDDISKLIEKMNHARSDRSEDEAFIRVYHSADEQYIWNRVHFVTMKNTANVPVKIISVFTDISGEKDGPLDEKRKDRTDFITNLYNKRATENKIKSYLYDEGASNTHAFIVAEICGFELIERDLGTVFANAVLKEVAANVRELFRDSDIIGRSSGSRFIVFVKGMSSHDKILEKSEQICRIIGNRYQSGTEDISIYGKAGVSVFPADGTTYDELYASAVKALYYAKHHSGKTVAFSSEIEGKTRLLHE